MYLQISHLNNKVISILSFFSPNPPHAHSLDVGVEVLWTGVYDHEDQRGKKLVSAGRTILRDPQGSCRRRQQGTKILHTLIEGPRTRVGQPKMKYWKLHEMHINEVKNVHPI